VGKWGGDQIKRDRQEKSKKGGGIRVGELHMDTKGPKDGREGLRPIVCMWEERGGFESFGGLF